jgi:site-specific DNA-adenine methylase
MHKQPASPAKTRHLSTGGAQPTSFHRTQPACKYDNPHHSLDRRQTPPGRPAAEQVPSHSCYVEVFAGGAAVFFARSPADVEVLNDVNGDLVNLYRVVTHHLEEFVRQFKWALSSRQVFKWLQETRPETLTDVQRAARFFYLQQQAFGGKVAGQTWGTATTAPAINLLRIEENLSAAHLRLADGVYIEQLDWAACIERYDRPHTLFYSWDRASEPAGLF